MQQWRLGLALGGVIALQATGLLFSQERPVQVTSSTPSGEVGQMLDANEIRIVFSEPMVALGGLVTSPPDWLTITPAIRANAYWSGTRTLIVTPDPDAPLPYATSFTVRVNASARSAAGHALPAPHTFSFSTPVVRLLGAEWYRKNGRADSPAVIALRFNQPVRPADVVAHTTARLEPHAWARPSISGAARVHLESTDPAGLRAFDDKVARIADVAGSSAPVPFALASSWDVKRFPPAPEVVVLETQGVPSPDSWIRLTTDERMPSPAGPLLAPVQSSVIRLEPAFFAGDYRCTSGCAPGGTSLLLRRGAERDAIAKALTIIETTIAQADRRLERGELPPNRYQPASGLTYAGMPDLGYPPQPPASRWILRLDSSLTSADGQTLGYPWTEIISTSHERPVIAWGGQVWEAGNGPVLPVMSRNVSEVGYWIAPMSPADVLPRLLDLRSRNAQRSPVVPMVTDRPRVIPDLFEAHGLDLRRWLNAGGTGLLFASLQPNAVLPNTVPTGSLPLQPALLQVTNLGLTVKDSPLSTLIAVSRLDTGAPVANARVSIMAPGAASPRWMGTTGADGVAMAPALAVQRQNMWDLSHVVTVEKDGDVAWVSSEWFGDTGPGSFNIRYGLEERAAVLRGSVFTDRGIYTRGEDVRVKGVFRSDTPQGMAALPADARVTLTITDARGRRIDERTLDLNRWGAVDFSLTVPADAALGSAWINARLSTDDPNRAPRLGGSFSVAAFRRPDFRVDTTLTSGEPLLGAPLEAVAEAKYLFGAPIGKEPVRWFVTRSGTRSIPAPIHKRFDDSRTAFGYVPVGSEERPIVSRDPNQDGTLDAEGRLRVTVKSSSGVDHAVTHRFEAEVPSASGQRIANRSDVVLHPASFYLGIARPPFFVDARVGLTTTVVAADLDGGVRSGVDVTVTLLREEWVSERRPENPGYEIWKTREVPAGEWSLRTAAQPASLKVPVADGGCFILRATARDEAGRPTRTDVRFYAYGGRPSPWRAQGNRIDLTPERTTLKPGETARVLVQSPWPVATALVTKEREGIRTYRRVPITSTQDVIEIPITEADVPNVYVSVVLTKGRTAATASEMDDDPGKPGVRLGYTELKVEDASKRLAVTVEADRKDYRPRESVAVRVGVSDAASRPRESEVTLWAVDYGLLSLTDYKAPDVARAIYAPKQLQVLTQDNRLQLIGRRSIVPAAAQGQAGGRGGGAGRAFAGGVPMLNESVEGFARASTIRGLPENMQTLSLDAARFLPADDWQLPEGTELRTDFRPVVFWLGSVTTDASGRASTTVTLPDSLTTYRIMAVAGDLRSHFGAAETEIRASKPLTMLPSFPRFLLRGDTASFGAIVTNNTAAPGDAVVRINAANPDVLAFGETTKTVRLAPGESQNVRFSASARGAGPARVRMSVTLGREADAFEMPLRVTMPIRMETVAAYGDTIASATEKIALPADALPGHGGLSVALASTALVGLGESATYVRDYPYECAEQKASKALALLLAADLSGAFPMPGMKPEDVRAAGLAALRSLGDYRCGDGGFGLFPGACHGLSSTYLTAYILDVMRRSAALGAPLDTLTTQRALDFLTGQARQVPAETQWWPAWAASQAYVVKVLAEGGRTPRDEVARLYAMASRMPVFALSYLADALAAMGDRGPRYVDVQRRITNALRVDADRAHVQELDEAALVWLWHTNVRATAVVLEGLARRGDDEALISPMVRWMLAARENGRWGTTQENAVALGALVSYYKRAESEPPDFAAAVTLAGREVGTAGFQGRTTTAREFTLLMPELVKAVSGGTGDLTVSRTGTGRLFYTARLHYASTTPDTAVTDRGMRIERRYQRYTTESLDPAATTFADGDLVRVTLSIYLPHEGRFLAFTDHLPAGFEPVDGSLKTTATDLGAVATTQSSAQDRYAWWRRGGFDHVEKHDDRVIAFATRLGAGRHEFTYLARATTAGTFQAPGATGEAMYAPEITGRSAGVRITVK